MSMALALYIASICDNLTKLSVFLTFVLSVMLTFSHVHYSLESREFLSKKWTVILAIILVISIIGDLFIPSYETVFVYYVSQHPVCIVAFSKLVNLLVGITF